MPSAKSILAGVSAISLALMPVVASANDSAAASLALSNATASNAGGTYSEQHKKRGNSFIYAFLGLAAAGGLIAALAGGGGGHKDRPASP